MRYNVKLLPIAYADLRAVEKWYKERGETLANDFKTTVYKKHRSYCGISRTLSEKI